MPGRPLARTAADVAHVRAVLETHAAVARRWSQEVPVGVDEHGNLTVDELRQLVSLAEEPLLRAIFSRLTKTEVQGLQSRLDDVQADEFSGGAALALQNLLMQQYNRAPTVAPTVAVRPTIPRPDRDGPVAPELMPELRDVFARALAPTSIQDLPEEEWTAGILRARARAQEKLDILASLRELGSSMPDTATRGDILRVWGASDDVYDRASRVAREWAVAEEWLQRAWADPVSGERNFF